MKITKQRLKEIIKEEIVNENLFRKLFGMADEKATKSTLAAINTFAEEWNDSGIYAPDMKGGGRHPSRKWRMGSEQFRDAVDELTYHNPAWKSMQKAITAGLNRTFDKKEIKLIQTAYHRVKNEINTMREIAGLRIDTDRQQEIEDLAVAQAAKDAKHAKSMAASEKFYSPEEEAKRKKERDRKDRASVASRTDDDERSWDDKDRWY